MTDLTMPNNIFTMKFPLKSVPGLADVGVPHGVGDGPHSSTQMSGVSNSKKFQITYLIMPNRISFMNCGLQ